MKTVSKLTNIIAPTATTDAANKQYVDSKVDSITPGISQSAADDRYLQLTGTAASATQLATSHNFSITGGATASAVAFNGTQDVALNITSLDATKLSGTIPTANLPSYVDDVVEYANLQAFPQIGESGKIYVALDTNLTYRWGGTEYVEISPSLALGETGSTAYRGDRGKTAYDHSQMLSGNPHKVTAAQVGALPLTGGTLTGNLNGKYFTGTWLQTTAVTEYTGSSYKGVAILDGSGWVYYRTLAHFLTDIGAVPTSRTVNGKALSSNITLSASDVGAGPGKRTARFTVGTSTAGWTALDCDYLCDGTADDVEINAAIQALPSTGGEIVILDGTYNITATIAMNKDNVKLSGNGNATVLKRMWDSSFGTEGIITITATNGGCCIENLFVDGNKANLSSYFNDGIYLASNNNTVTGNICNNNSLYGIYLTSSDNNTVTGNTCNGNNNGIYLTNSDNNTITGNTCNNNDNYGIELSGDNNTITGNTCSGNNCGIYLSNSNNNTIIGNTCNNNNSYGIYLTSSDNNTVTGNTCNNNNNSYGIYLTNSDNNTITGNTCSGNNCGIYLSNSNNNTVTGNTCIRGTGQSSDYTTSQYTIRIGGSSNNYNLIAYNNIMGKDVVINGGTSNTSVGNKYS